MKFIYEPLKELSNFENVVEAVSESKGRIGVIGPSDSQKAHFCCAFLNEIKRKAVIVTYNELQAKALYQDYTFLLGDGVLLLSPAEYILYDIEAKSYESTYNRLKVLEQVVNGDYKVVIVSSEVLCQRIMTPDKFKANMFTIDMDSMIDMEALSEKLQQAGYERVGTIEGKGQYAIRGSIFDIFPVNSDEPVRIDFFGDEIDSIRSFDVDTQRSTKNIDSINIIPAREILIDDAEREKIITDIKADYSDQLETYIKADLEDSFIRTFKERIEHDINRFENFRYFPGIDRYVPFIFQEYSTILDYVKDNLIVLDDSNRIRERINNINFEHNESCKNMLEKGLALNRLGQLYDGSHRFFIQLKEHMAVYTYPFSASPEDAIRKNKTFKLVTRNITGIGGKTEILMDQIKDWKNEKYKIVILTAGRSRGERLCEIMKDYGIEASFYGEYPDNIQPGQIVITNGALRNSFEYPEIKYVVLSDSDFFAKKTKQGRRKNKGKPINAFTDLTVGDYVVHDFHGIGQYMGFEQIKVSGITRDYIKIKYADNGFLYVPTNQMDLVQKFIGADGKAPKVNKLGSNDWAKTKTKVKASLRELAGELVKLYATRQAVKGFKFSPDTVWQKEFEEAFPYEETDDQMRCVEEIKKDMESDRPMERLLCGDVGYGKTEVALRAAFKAVMDSKQVAFLVPTTVLAQQHYINIKERMKDFPIKVDYICRFRTTAEQKEILKKLARGEIDILIGTHRILQKDVVFKDLGLLIIDEEQRFGVAHKDKFKKLKPNIDILTLSATPIPRTLHMSLVSIRDISIIEEPPQERFPVQTYVLEYNQLLIRDAIYREMARSGQVFYLYNRVRTIDIKAYELNQMIPEARIAIAHGQMSERELENTMSAFIAGEYDILVCTTIIESGLDMPNANTIIVEDSDRLGLAQLYQIRGRVGRSNKMAYAYLTYKKDKQLAEESEKRLQAIREFTEFGSGFKIAMRDMEIRGAGNLLGAKQHGQMENVGYDMYCKLLEKAVKEIRNDEDSSDVEEENFTIDISIDAFIDGSYVPEEEDRLEIYKKISLIESEEDASDVYDELVDRYGEVPVEVENLISVAEVKGMATKKGFISIVENKDKGSVVLKFAKDAKINVESIGNVINLTNGQILFNAGAEPYIVYKPGDIKKKKLLDNLMKIFDVY